MTEMERLFWIDVRAALLQIAAAILRYKLGGGDKKEVVHPSQSDTVTGVSTYTTD